MFKTQSYKQKLSFHHNDDVDNIANINIILSTNHEINKDILQNLTDVMEKLFINNYTNMDDIIKKANEDKQKLKDDKKDEMQKKRDEMQHKRDDAQKRRDERDINKKVWDDHQDYLMKVKKENAKLKDVAKDVMLKQSVLKPHWKRKA